MRKKKVQKKVARLQEIEEAREKEKQRWKEFAYKSAKKGAPIGGKQKRSIFAVPDSIHGKVNSFLKFYFYRIKCDHEFVSQYYYKHYSNIHR